MALLGPPPKTNPYAAKEVMIGPSPYYGATPQEPAKPTGSLTGDLALSWEIGWQQMRGVPYWLKGVGASLLEKAGFEDKAREQRIETYNLVRDMQEDIGALSALYTGPHSWSEAQKEGTIGSYALWGINEAIKQIPNLATMALGSLATMGVGTLAFAGAKTGARFAVARMLQKMPGAKYTLPTGEVVSSAGRGSATVGVALSSALLNTGEIYSSALLETGENNPAITGLSGLLAGTLDMWPGSKIIRNMGKGQDFGSYIANKLLRDKKWRSRAYRALELGVTESFVEDWQTLIEAMTVNYLNDNLLASDYVTKAYGIVPLTAGQVSERMEARAAGALLGTLLGPFGRVGPGFKSPPPDAKIEVEDVRDIDEGVAVKEVLEREATRPYGSTTAPIREVTARGLPAATVTDPGRFAGVADVARTLEDEAVEKRKVGMPAGDAFDLSDPTTMQAAEELGLDLDELALLSPKKRARKFERAQLHADAQRKAAQTAAQVKERITGEKAGPLSTGETASVAGGIINSATVDSPLPDSEAYKRQKDIETATALVLRLVNQKKEITEAAESKQFWKDVMVEDYLAAAELAKDAKKIGVAALRALLKGKGRDVKRDKNGQPVIKDGQTQQEDLTLEDLGVAPQEKGEKAEAFRQRLDEGIRAYIGEDVFADLAFDEAIDEKASRELAKEHARLRKLLSSVRAINMGLNIDPEIRSVLQSVFEQGRDSYIPRNLQDDGVRKALEAAIQKRIEDNIAAQKEEVQRQTARAVTGFIEAQKKPSVEKRYGIEQQRKRRKDETEAQYQERLIQIEASSLERQAELRVIRAKDEEAHLVGRERKKVGARPSYRKLEARATGETVEDEVLIAGEPTTVERKVDVAVDIKPEREGIVTLAPEGARPVDERSYENFATLQKFWELVGMRTKQRGEEVEFKWTTEDVKRLKKIFPEGDDVYNVEYFSNREMAGDKLVKELIEEIKARRKKAGLPNVKIKYVAPNGNYVTEEKPDPAVDIWELERDPSTGDVLLFNEEGEIVGSRNSSTISTRTRLPGTARAVRRKAKKHMGAGTEGQGEQVQLPERLIGYDSKDQLLMSQFVDDERNYALSSRVNSLKREYGSENVPFVELSKLADQFNISVGVLGIERTKTRTRFTQLNAQGDVTGIEEVWFQFPESTKYSMGRGKNKVEFNISGEELEHSFISFDFLANRYSQLVNVMNVSPDRAWRIALGQTMRGLKEDSANRYEQILLDEGNADAAYLKAQQVAGKTLNKTEQKLVARLDKILQDEGAIWTVNKEREIEKFANLNRNYITNPGDKKYRIKLPKGAEKISSADILKSISESVSKGTKDQPSWGYSETEQNFLSRMSTPPSPREITRDTKVKVSAEAWPIVFQQMVRKEGTPLRETVGAIIGLQEDLKYIKKGEGSVEQLNDRKALIQKQINNLQRILNRQVGDILDASYNVVRRKGDSFVLEHIPRGPSLEIHKDMLMVTHYSETAINRIQATEEKILRSPDPEQAQVKIAKYEKISLKKKGRSLNQEEIDKIIKGVTKTKADWKRHEETVEYMAGPIYEDITLGDRPEWRTMSGKRMELGKKARNKVVKEIEKELKKVDASYKADTKRMRWTEEKYEARVQEILDSRRWRILEAWGELSSPMQPMSVSEDIQKQINSGEISYEQGWRKYVKRFKQRERTDPESVRRGRTPLEYAEDEDVKDIRTLMNASGEWMDAAMNSERIREVAKSLQSGDREFLRSIKHQATLKKAPIEGILSRLQDRYNNLIVSRMKRGEKLGEKVESWLIYEGEGTPKAWAEGKYWEFVRSEEERELPDKPRYLGRFVKAAPIGVWKNAYGVVLDKIKITYRPNGETEDITKTVYQVTNPFDVDDQTWFFETRKEAIDAFGKEASYQKMLGRKALPSPKEFGGMAAAREIRRLNEEADIRLDELDKEKGIAFREREKERADALKDAEKKKGAKLNLRDRKRVLRPLPQLNPNLTQEEKDAAKVTPQQRAAITKKHTVKFPVSQAIITRRAFGDVPLKHIRQAEREKGGSLTRDELNILRDQLYRGRPIAEPAGRPVGQETGSAPITTPQVMEDARKKKRQATTVTVIAPGQKGAGRKRPLTVVETYEEDIDFSEIPTDLVGAERYRWLIGKEKVRISDLEKELQAIESRKEKLPSRWTKKRKEQEEKASEIRDKIAFKNRVLKRLDEMIRVAAPSRKEYKATDIYPAVPPEQIRAEIIRREEAKREGEKLTAADLREVDKIIKELTPEEIDDIRLDIRERVVAEIGVEARTDEQIEAEIERLKKRLKALGVKPPSYAYAGRPETIHARDVRIREAVEAEQETKDFVASLEPIENKIRLASNKVKSIESKVEEMPSRWVKKRAALNKTADPFRKTAEKQETILNQKKAELTEHREERFDALLEAEQKAEQKKQRTRITKGRRALERKRALKGKAKAAETKKQNEIDETNKKIEDLQESLGTPRRVSTPVDVKYSLVLDGEYSEDGGLHVLFGGKEGGSSARDDVVDRLNEAFGRQIFQFVRVVQTQAELPLDFRMNREAYESPIRGVSWNRQIWLVADNMSLDRVVPVALHEIGGHGMMSITGKKFYDRLMKQIAVLVNTDDSIRAIYERVKEETSEREGVQVATDKDGLAVFEGGLDKTAPIAGTHVSSNIESLSDGFKIRRFKGDPVGVSIARIKSEEMSSPTLAEPGGTPGVVSVIVSGRGMDYMDPADRKIIDDLQEESRKKSAAAIARGAEPGTPGTMVSAIPALLERGVDWVNGWNGIGEDSELHVINPSMIEIVGRGKKVTAVNEAVVLEETMAYIIEREAIANNPFWRAVVDAVLYGLARIKLWVSPTRVGAADILVFAKATARKHAQLAASGDAMFTANFLGTYLYSGDFGHNSSEHDAKASLVNKMGGDIGDIHMDTGFVSDWFDRDVPPAGRLWENFIVFRDVTAPKEGEAILKRPLIHYRVRKIGKKRFQVYIAPEFIKWMKDYFNIFTLLEESTRIRGGTVTDDNSPSLFHGAYKNKVNDWRDRFHKEYVEPLADYMYEYRNEFDGDDLFWYLYTAHAPHRNRLGAKKAKEAQVPNASGLFDTKEQAQAYRDENPEAGEEAYMSVEAELEKLHAKVGDETSDAWKHLEIAAQKVYMINQYNLNNQLEAGLLDFKTMTPEQLEAYNDDGYKDTYVPLRGQERIVADQFFEQPLGPGKLGVSGVESKRARGRQSIPENIWAWSVMQTDHEIDRIEKNLVVMSFANLIWDNEENYKDFAMVVPLEDYKKHKDPSGKLFLDLIPKQQTDPDHNIHFKINGEEWVILVKDKRLGQAFNRSNMTDSGVFLQLTSQLNRYFSAIHTSINPEFVLRNFTVDLQTALGNLEGLKETVAEFKDIEGLSRAVLKSVKPAGIGLKHFLRDGRTDTEYSAEASEFSQHGGRINFFAFKDVRDFEKSFNDHVKDTKVGGAKRFFKKTLDFISDYNAVVENTMRLAVYHHAKKAFLAAGMTEGQAIRKAVHIAQNLTVNFSQKGEKGAALNALYLFFNASVQGTARLFQALFSRPRGKTGFTRVQKLAGSIMLFGFAQGILNAVLAGDDEDGINRYSQIDLRSRSRQAHIYLPGFDTFFKIPLPYGYNVFHVMGDTLAALMMGHTNPGRATMHLMSSSAESFMPFSFGSSDNLFRATLSAVSPTFADPLVDLAMNESYFGQPIYKDPVWGSSDPPSERFWGSTGPITKGISRGLNALSGGNQIKPGLISIPPDIFEFIWETAAGGAGRFVERTTDLVLSIGPGKITHPTGEIKWNKVPFARRFLFDEKASKNRYRYDKFAVYEKLISTAVGMEKGMKEVYGTGKEYTNFKESDDYKLYKLADFRKNIVGSITKLQKERNKLRRNRILRSDIIDDRVDRLEEKMMELRTKLINKMDETFDR